MKEVRKRKIPYDITYMGNLKCGTDEPICKTETDSQTWEIDVVAKREGREGGRDWEFGADRGKLLCSERISNEVLLYSAGNYVQFLGVEHEGRQYEGKKCKYMDDWATTLCSRS